MCINFLLGLFSDIVLVVGVLVGVAFLTLLERSVLEYIQIRQSPTFADAIKHFTF